LSPNKHNNPGIQTAPPLTFCTLLLGRKRSCIVAAAHSCELQLPG